MIDKALIIIILENMDMKERRMILVGDNVCTYCIMKNNICFPSSLFRVFFFEYAEAHYFVLLIMSLFSFTVIDYFFFFLIGRF